MTFSANLFDQNSKSAWIDKIKSSQKLIRNSIKEALKKFSNTPFSVLNKINKICQKCFR